MDTLDISDLVIFSMRFLRLLLLLSLIPFFSGCGEEEEILFTFTLQEEFFLPAGLNAFTQHVFLQRGAISNYMNVLEATSYTDDDVAEVQPGRAQMRGRQGNEFHGHIDELIIRAVNPDDLTDKIEIFYQDRVRRDESGDLDLFGSTTEVKEWMTRDELDLEIIFIFRTVTSQSQDLLFDLEFVAKG